jgi:hypothetical protein
MNIFPPAFLTLAAMTGLASATVVNIDFGTSLVTNVYVGQAAAADPAGCATATWNPLLNVSGTASSVALKDSTNTTTGIGFTVSGIETTISAAPAENEQAGGYVSLMRDYIRIDGVAAGTVVSTAGKFTGLTVGGTYDLYFYGQGQNMSPLGSGSLLRGQNSLFTIGGTSKQTSWDGVGGGDGILTEGVEFVKFTSIADINGEINFSWANVVATGATPNVATDLAPNNNTPPTNTASRYGALNAVQLVEVVPEPSTALLSALGILGLIVRRRR